MDTETIEMIFVQTAVYCDIEILAENIFRCHAGVINKYNQQILNLGR